MRHLLNLVLVYAVGAFGINVTAHVTHLEEFQGEERASVWNHVVETSQTIRGWLEWIGKKLLYLLKRFIGYQPPVNASKTRLETKSAPLQEKETINHAGDAPLLEKATIEHAATQSGTETNLESNLQKQTHMVEDELKAHSIPDVVKLPALELDKASLKVYQNLIEQKTPENMANSLRGTAFRTLIFGRDLFKNVVHPYVKACEDTAKTRSGDTWGVEAAFKMLQASGMLHSFTKKLEDMEKAADGTQKSATTLRIRLGLNELALKKKWTKEDVSKLFGKNILIETAL
ncbi:uncharacterized protein PHALS_10162 [Plasmopara halstedii]|uniref:RxLR-like protein n=1 Tax=Plasmopara halstedii TaxID=4781 RepID=A0A0P1AG90_PLAHL|nr:uncharacterized protein PHALS_10162 [Plasmopara halstedii]CEG39936.1 hypothetical protein PHALS_10162 [Plasmopara halstedii]|eukprot:XP_024576305.1 hypothetical protein PHALS_10162 [Plasmopara halstedii]